MKIFQIVKRQVVQLVVNDVVNFAARIKLQRVLSHVVVALNQERHALLSRTVTMAPARLVSRVALRRTVEGFVIGQARSLVGLSRTVTPFRTGAHAVTEAAVGRAVTRIRYTLAHARGAAAAVDDGPANWTNPSNAEGKSDGSTATRSGQTIGSSEANLRLTYDALVGKDELAINEFSGVLLRFHVSQSGTTLGNGGLHLEYRLAAAGAWTTLETITGDVDNLASPRQHHLTAAVGGDWVNLQDVQVRVRAILGAATGGVTCSVDAVELHVNASRTDEL